MSIVTYLSMVYFVSSLSLGNNVDFDLYKIGFNPDARAAYQKYLDCPVLYPNGYNSKYHCLPEQTKRELMSAFDNYGKTVPGFIYSNYKMEALPKNDKAMLAFEQHWISKLQHGDTDGDHSFDGFEIICNHNDYDSKYFYFTKHYNIEDVKTVIDWIRSHVK